MILRRAILADAADVLAWRNDPVTRAMSRNGDAVGEAEHLAWFARAIADPSRILLIGEDAGAKVGMVRIDRGAESEVSINVNPACRGRGLRRRPAGASDGPGRRAALCRDQARATPPAAACSRRPASRRPASATACCAIAAARRARSPSPGAPIGPDEPPFVIAELSGNHNGDVGRALALIDAAKAAGADAVKLQTYTADTITIDHDGPGFVIESRPLERPAAVRALPGGLHALGMARARCSSTRQSAGLTVFSTPFDATRRRLPRAPRSAGLQDRLLRAGRPAADPAAARDRQAADHLDRPGRAGRDRRGGGRPRAAAGARDLVLLHCTSGYPTPRARDAPAHHAGPGRRATACSSASPTTPWGPPSRLRRSRLAPA